MNEAMWSLGMVMYSIAYATLGKEATAAVQISITIQNIFMVFAFGLAGACAMAENGCDNLDYDIREKLYCASIYGGLAINVTGTCFPHTMGYLLTETFGIPHGTACAVFQRDFYEYNKTVVPALAAEFMERIGCSEEEYLTLIAELTPPCEVTMKEALIAESHSRWVNNGSMAKCQGVFGADMADAVLRRKFLEK